MGKDTAVMQPFSILIELKTEAINLSIERLMALLYIRKS